MRKIRIIKMILCLNIAVLIFLTPLSGVFAQETAVDGTEILGIVKISEKNTAEDVKKYLDDNLDGVSVEAEKTADGLLTVRGKIPLQKITSEVGKKILIIDCDENDFQSVAGFVKNIPDRKNIFIRCKGMKNDDLIQNSDGCNVIVYHKSNVIFRALSELKKAEKNNQPIAQFATKNQYGVIFGEFLTSRFDIVRGMFSFADKDRCGGRSDNIEGWENIIACGYSVLESENPEGLSRYLSLIDSEKAKLRKTVSEVKDNDLSSYSKQSVTDFEKAVAAAEEIMNGKKPHSASEISKADEALSEAFKNLKPDDKAGSGKGEFNITFSRVIPAVLIVALFVAVQVIIKKRTVK